MYRRLYFLFPDSEHVVDAVDELLQAGIPKKHLHTIAGKGIDITKLPIANELQKKDRAALIEWIVWQLNLAIFFIALIVMLTMPLWTEQYWMLVPLSIMLVTFLLGQRFTSKIPNVHLEEFRSAIKHGEILLMVDVPKSKVDNVEEIVHYHHPEAVVGGIGWTSNILQL